MSLVGSSKSSAKAFRLALVSCVIMTFGQTSFGADMSPSNWSAAIREHAERLEAADVYPYQERSLNGKDGVICASVSPIAVEVGIETLKNGGSAADAAATVALTQVTTQLGSVVSFAGVMSLVYYDAKTKKVYSMDAGYNSYLHEKDPKSIPVSDLGPLNASDKKASEGLANKFFKPATAGGEKGRETLVPGFMAGIEAMHTRFGKLPFSDLFQPAIWYAEHGITINYPLEYFFATRQKFLARTSEGQEFLHQAGTNIPKFGDRFVQPKLAETLRAIAQHGAKYMYSGAWGEHFVNTIGKDGGKVCAQDMSGYRVVWSEPLSITYLGHQVFTVGKPAHSAYYILTGLNLAESLKLEERESYRKDPTVLCDFERISDATTGAPLLDEKFITLLKGKGIDCSPAAQLTKQYANKLAPLLAQLDRPSTNDVHHSNSIVVVDKDGNIAAITHSINTVIWGDTGIVVDGIPIPDSAGFQQTALAKLKPGSRLPNDMMPTIVCKDKKPILATAAIGMSMIPETLRIIVGVVGNKLNLATLQAAPPVLVNITADPAKSPFGQGLVVPKGAYGQAYLDALEHLNVKVTAVPDGTVSGLRGTVTAVTIDPVTAEKHTVETPSVMNFSAAF